MKKIKNSMWWVYFPPHHPFTIRKIANSGKTVVKISVMVALTPVKFASDTATRPAGIIADTTNSSTPILIASLFMVVFSPPIFTIENNEIYKYIV